MESLSVGGRELNEIFNQDSLGNISIRADFVESCVGKAHASFLVLVGIQVAIRTFLVYVSMWDFSRSKTSQVDRLQR